MNSVERDRIITNKAIECLEVGVRRHGHREACVWTSVERSDDPIETLVETHVRQVDACKFCRCGCVLRVALLHHRYRRRLAKGYRFLMQRLKYRPFESASSSSS